MDRRSFLKGSCKACMVMSAGMLLGASLLESCAGLGGSVLKVSQNAGKIRMPISDFAVQKTRLVRVSNYAYDIAVREISEGQFIALLMKCTHAGQPLTQAGSGFYCTLHGSRFSPTGIVETGPASQPLAHLPATVENGQLVLTLIDPSKV